MSKILSMRRLLIAGLILVLAFAAGLYVRGHTFAADPPHAPNLLTPPQSVYCNSCHSVHKAVGTALTKEAYNYNLCWSCHNVGSIASTKAFNDAMKAVPGTSGTSHRWDTAMPATSAPNNQYGLKATADLTNGALKSRLGTYGNVITCSVCHNQHGQASTPWDPNSATTYVPGTTNNRHFQRTSNDLNQMCEDCHAYRVQAHTTIEGPGDGIKVFSHPVGQTLNANGKGYDRAAPLDVNGLAQSGARFATGAETPTDNTTNNLVVEGTTNKVRCLSCHRVHYTDSNGFSVDGSP